jgi:hypothetical protein
MRFWIGSALAALSALASFTAVAGERPPAPQAEPQKAVETLKERLSDKASDEQRVDNCNVPPEKRGAKKRPDACAPTSPQEARK